MPDPALGFLRTKHMRICHTGGFFRGGFVRSLLPDLASKISENETRECRFINIYRVRALEGLVRF